MATGVCALGCTSDGKMAMGVSKVPEALGFGAELWTHTRVERILQHRGNVFGVAARTPPGRVNGRRTGPVEGARMLVCPRADCRTVEVRDARFCSRCGTSLNC